MKLGSWLVMALAFLPMMGADGLLTRLERHSHELRLHPDSCGPAAFQLWREANDAADRWVAQGLPVEASRLRWEAAELAAAAHNSQPEEVRAHAIEVEHLVVQVASLP